jgi:hypothetical protein
VLTISLWGGKMKRLLLLVGLLFWSCEDERVEIPVVEDIGMWVNGDIIPVYDYYESITTFGKKIIQEDGSVKKIFVIHFQKDLGRITPEKEHYALIFYDIDADDDNDLIDLGVYVNPDTASSKGITLEIVGVSDYTVNAQGIINELYSNVVSGYAEGTFWNPYREEFQNGLVVFENLPISTDTTNTFYSEFY